MTRPRHTVLAGVLARDLRRDTTIAEAHLWRGLKKQATGARIPRQMPTGIYIVDFAALRPNLVLEVDDMPHEFKDETKRSHFIESQGFPILRFTNREIRDDVHAAIQTVTSWVSFLKEHGHPPPD